VGLMDIDILHAHLVFMLSTHRWKFGRNGDKCHERSRGWRCSLRVSDLEFSIVEVYHREGGKWTVCL